MRGGRTGARSGGAARVGSAPEGRWGGAGVSQSGNNVPPPAPGFAAAWAGAAPRREGLLGDHGVGNGEPAPGPGDLQAGGGLGCWAVRAPGRGWSCAGAANPVSLPQHLVKAQRGGAGGRGGSRSSGAPQGLAPLPSRRGAPAERQPPGRPALNCGSAPAAPNSLGFCLGFLFCFVLPRKQLINNPMSRNGRKAPCRAAALRGSITACSSAPAPPVSSLPAGRGCRADPGALGRHSSQESELVDISLLFKRLTFCV